MPESAGAKLLHDIIAGSHLFWGEGAQLRKYEIVARIGIGGIGVEYIELGMLGSVPP
jgi:hypothetical protein